MRELTKPRLGRLLALLGWLWWGIPALAQAPFPVSGGHAEDLYSDLAFDKVWVLQEAHRYEESVPEIRKIIAANPGTELEAAAMVRLASTLRLLSSQAARHGNALLAADLKSQSDAVWQQMVDRFPGTKYWLNARAELLQSPEAYHALLEEVGGPSYEAVRSGQLLQCDGEAIPLQYRQYVKDAFEFGPYGASFEEEARFRLFFLRSFPEDSTIWELRNFYLGGAAVDLDLSDDLSAPNVEVSAPLDGARVSPEAGGLVVTADDGVLRSHQIHLATAIVELDGVNIFPACQLDCKVDPAGPKAITIEIRYTPPQPFPPGAHTYRVSMQDGQGLITEKFVNFTVADQPPPPDPTTQTLPASKDSILSQQNPHRNEGANDLLQLSHRPEERNKSNNPLVAFDLSNVNLNGLTKARLVLNIQECEQPKKWGPEGRNILAYPVNEAWVEGNGETIKTGQSERTRGEGRGVTWFSPIDENIANKVPNGALQWSGARPFLGPLSAPPVLIMNRQTGTVEFDVTQDVRSGFTDGWLVRKQDEAAFGNVRFFSKEGAAEAGNANLAPRLILEYGSPSVSQDSAWRGLLASFGLARAEARLRARGSQAESTGLKDFLRDNPGVALVGEQVVLSAVGVRPLAELGLRLSYRSWLRGEPSLV